MGKARKIPSTHTHTPCIFPPPQNEAKEQKTAAVGNVNRFTCFTFRQFYDPRRSLLQPVPKINSNSNAGSCISTFWGLCQRPPTCAGSFFFLLTRCLSCSSSRLGEAREENLKYFPPFFIGSFISVWSRMCAMSNFGAASQIPGWYDD